MNYNYIYVYLYANFPYFILDLSCQLKYSVYISLTRKRWNTTIKQPMATKTNVGNPPRWWPCLWSAITSCLWAGAKKNCTVLIILLLT